MFYWSALKRMGFAALGLLVLWALVFWAADGGGRP